MHESAGDLGVQSWLSSNSDTRLLSAALLPENLRHKRPGCSDPFREAVGLEGGDLRSAHPCTQNLTTGRGLGLKGF